MDDLIVRMYNVHFGDAILISIPDTDETGKPKTKHILIDVGNVKSGEGGLNAIFEPVVNDIIRVLDGEPLDLYIMTHEHLDHVQGLLWAAKEMFTESELKEKLSVKNSWLPISAHPDYYENYPDAKKKFQIATSIFNEVKAFSNVAQIDNREQLDVLIQNNNRFIKSDGLNLSIGRTADCVEYLRQLAGDNTHYVYRSTGNDDDNPLYDLTETHTFNTVGFEIWAPEENSADYYGRFRPMALGINSEGGNIELNDKSLPPSGVEANSFFNLLNYRRGSLIDNMLAIDKSANNSSIVFSLEWNGWKLLFPGDAEERSWKEMNKEGVLTPVDFLKVSHHGSHNGTPDNEILTKIFPSDHPNRDSRKAAVSTFLNTYNGIPHIESLDELRDLGCEIFSTLDVEGGKALEIRFSAKNDA